MLYHPAQAKAVTLVTAKPSPDPLEKATFPTPSGNVRYPPESDRDSNLSGGRDVENPTARPGAILVRFVVNRRQRAQRRRSRP